MQDNPLTTAVEVISTESDGLQQMAKQLSTPESDLARGFFAAFETIKAASGRIIVSGMGKSGHVARKIAATLASTGTPALFVHPAEASHGDLGMIGDEDVVIALSNSGETPELRDVIAYCGRYDIPLIAITSHTDSSLGRAADICLPLPAAKEACGETKAPTTSTTMSMAVGDALAVALLRDKGFSKDDFHTYHPGGKLGATLQKVRDLMHAGRDLPVVNETTDMREATAVLTRCGFGCVGVVNGDSKLVGIITDGDIRRHLSADLMEQPAHIVMTRSPKVVTPSTLAAEALGVLSKTKITALFVVEDGQPVGLLHVHDMLSTGVL